MELKIDTGLLVNMSWSIAESTATSKIAKGCSKYDSYYNLEFGAQLQNTYMYILVVYLIFILAVMEAYVVSKNLVYLLQVVVNAKTHQRKQILDYCMHMSIRAICEHC